MTTLTPVTSARHAAMRWRRYDSYSFAADRAIIPLVVAELARAALAFPIAFIRMGKAFVPAGILGLERNRNLFVVPDGRWFGSYVPAALRGHPFSLGRADDGRQLLCVDETSGLVTSGPTGERFFEDDNTLSTALRRVMDFLTKIEQQRAGTTAACAALAARDLIEPWLIARKGERGESKNVEGLFRMNEGALNALNDEAFLGLRKSGALPIAYAQLLSMQQLRILSELAAVRIARAPPVPLGQDLDLSWMDNDVLKLDTDPR
jgi:hypothetical protein